MIDRFTRALLSSPTITTHEAAAMARLHKDRCRRLENRKLKPPVKQAPPVRMRS